MNTIRHERRHFLQCLAAAPLFSALAARAAPASLVVYRDPSCGCCGAWVDHVRAAGFAVSIEEVDDTAPVRRRLGLDPRFGSCHTATVAGYVIEGHVPAEQIERLLAARPDALGLAVPGMPIGSPGMEMDGRAEPYDVLLVDRRGQATVFARYPSTRARQAHRR